eukprot:6863067-Heterocapsa_arctica.AAC.1
MAAGKDMTHIGLKEIENNIETEHCYNREKFWDIMEGMEKMSQRKKDEMEEERAKTESEEEEEEQMTGARANDMS